MSFGNLKYLEIWCYICKRMQHLIRDVQQCKRSVHPICRFGGNSITI